MGTDNDGSCTQHQGNAELSQKMMRARVLAQVRDAAWRMMSAHDVAQGGTVALMLASSGWYAFQEPAKPAEQR